jgi:hypothetical protein
MALRLCPISIQKKGIHKVNVGAASSSDRWIFTAIEGYD